MIELIFFCFIIHTYNEEENTKNNQLIYYTKPLKKTILF